MSSKSGNLFHSRLRLLRLKRAGYLKICLKYIALWTKALNDTLLKLFLKHTYCELKCGFCELRKYFFSPWVFLQCIVFLNFGIVLSGTFHLAGGPPRPNAGQGKKN